MKTPVSPQSANQNPDAKSNEAPRGSKPQKRDRNFPQARDIRADRGTRQIKNPVRIQSAARGR